MSSDDIIARLRAQFESELTANPSLYHPIDIERVRSEDWQIRRFLIEHEEEEKAYKALLRGLQWKKSFGIHERTAQYFPIEMYVLSGGETVGEDKEGRLIGWGSAKNHRPFKELHLIQRQFVAHQFERMDRLAGEKGFVSVTDARGTSMFNADSEMQKFQNELFTYYPAMIKGMYLVEMPWLLNTIMKLFISWMDPKLAKLLHLIKVEQLPEYIPIEHIPVSLNGPRDTPQNIPENLLPLAKLAPALGLDDKFVDHYYKTYKLERPL